MPHFKFRKFQVVTDILHLHGQKLIAYKGDYDTYERTRVEQLKNQQKAFESNERSRAHMQVFHHTNSSYQQQLDSTQSTFVFFPKFTFFCVCFCIVLEKLLQGGQPLFITLFL